MCDACAYRMCWEGRAAWRWRVPWWSRPWCCSVTGCWSETRSARTSSTPNHCCLKNTQIHQLQQHNFDAVFRKLCPNNWLAPPTTNWDWRLFSLENSRLTTALTSLGILFLILIQICVPDRYNFGVLYLPVWVGGALTAVGEGVLYLPVWAGGGLTVWVRVWVRVWGTYLCERVVDWPVWVRFHASWGLVLSQGLMVLFDWVRVSSPGCYCTVAPYSGSHSAASGRFLIN